MGTARVQSTDAIGAFRPALIHFADAGQSALDEINSSFQRTIDWLRLEQRDHWKRQIRRRTEAVTQAKDAYRRKRLFLDATGMRPSAIDERRALERAKRQLEEAHWKLAATERWARSLEKHVLEYRANTQALAGTLEHDIPVAVARLDRMLGALGDYAAESQAQKKTVPETSRTNQESEA